MSGFFIPTDNIGYETRNVSGYYIPENADNAFQPPNSYLPPQTNDLTPITPDLLNPAETFTPQPYPAEAFAPQPYPAEAFTPQPYPAEAFTPQPYPAEAFAPEPYAAEAFTPVEEYTQFGGVNPLDSVKAITIGDDKVKDLIQIDERGFDPAQYTDRVPFSSNYCPDRTPGKINIYRAAFKKVFGGEVPLNINSPSMPCDREQYDIIWKGLVFRYNKLNDEVIADTNTFGATVAVRAKFEKYLMLGRLLENIQKMDVPCTVYTEDGTTSSEQDDKDIDNLIYAFIFAVNQSRNPTLLFNPNNPQESNMMKQYAFDASGSLHQLATLVSRLDLDTYTKKVDTDESAKKPTPHLRNLYLELDGDEFKRQVDAKVEGYKADLLEKLDAQLKGSIGIEKLKELKGHIQAGGDGTALTAREATLAAVVAPQDSARDIALAAAAAAPVAAARHATLDRIAAAEGDLIGQVKAYGVYLNQEEDKANECSKKLTESTQSLKESNTRVANLQSKVEKLNTEIANLQREFQTSKQCCAGTTNAQQQLRAFEEMYRVRTEEFNKARENLTQQVKESSIRSQQSLDSVQSAKEELLTAQQKVIVLQQRLQTLQQGVQKGGRSAIAEAFSKYIQSGGWRTGGNGALAAAQTAQAVAAAAPVAAPAAPGASNIILPALQPGTTPPPAYNDILNSLKQIFSQQNMSSLVPNSLNPVPLVSSLLGSVMSTARVSEEVIDVNQQKGVLNSAVTVLKQKVQDLDNALKAIKSSSTVYEDDAQKVKMLASFKTQQEQNAQLLSIVEKLQATIAATPAAPPITAADIPVANDTTPVADTAAIMKELEEDLAEVKAYVNKAQSMIIKATIEEVAAQQKVAAAEVGKIALDVKVSLATSDTSAAAAAAAAAAATELQSAQAALTAAKATVATAEQEVAKVNKEVQQIIAKGAAAQAKANITENPATGKGIIASEQAALAELDKIVSEQAKAAEVSADSTRKAVEAAHKTAQAEIVAAKEAAEAEAAETKAETNKKAADAAVAAARTQEERDAALAAQTKAKFEEQEAATKRSAAVLAAAAATAAASAQQQAAAAAAAAAASAKTQQEAAATAVAAVATAPPARSRTPVVAPKKEPPVPHYNTAKRSIKGVIGTILLDILADGQDTALTQNKSISSIFVAPGPKKSPQPPTLAQYKKTEMYTFIKSYKTSTQYFNGITPEIIADPDGIAMAFSILFKNLMAKPPRSKGNPTEDMKNVSMWGRDFIIKLSSAFLNSCNISVLKGKDIVFDPTISSTQKRQAFVAELDKKLLSLNLLEPGPTKPYPVKKMITKAGQPANPVKFTDIFAIPITDLVRNVKLK